MHRATRNQRQYTVPSAPRCPAERIWRHGFESAGPDTSGRTSRERWVDFSRRPMFDRTHMEQKPQSNDPPTGSTTIDPGTQPEALAASNKTARERKSNSKSIRGLAARLQENEAEKRRLCKARESCTLDRAAMLGEEFGHCSEGGSTTQGSAELTAPAFPRRECLSDRRDGHPPIASLAGVIPRSGPRFKPVASRPERRRAAFKAADSPERRRWPPAQRLLLRYTVRSRLMPCGFGWRLISATSTTPASMTQRGENGSVALVAGVKETAA